VSLSIRTGVGPGEWLDDTRALMTAAEIIHDADRRAERERRKGR